MAKASKTALELIFELFDKGYRVAGVGNCTEADLVIPETYNGLPVVEIKQGAFAGCRNLTSVVVPNSVTTIGEHAFHGCSSLEQIEVPAKVAHIGDYAFADCGALKSLTFPHNLRAIGLYAYAGTNITGAVLPSSIISIGEGAFNGCESLENISIPNSVTTIGDYAFARCNSLTSVSIPDSVKSIGFEAFGDCSALSSVIIPDGVKSIARNAFVNCPLKRVIIPDDAEISSTSFPPKCKVLRRSEIKSLTISDDETEIRREEYKGLKFLKKINIPDSVTAIGRSAFAGCESLKSVTIPESVTAIDFYAFAGTSLKKIILPEGYDKSSVYLPNGCKALYPSEVAEKKAKKRTKEKTTEVEAAVPEEPAQEEQPQTMWDKIDALDIQALVKTYEDAYADLYDNERNFTNEQRERYEQAIDDFDANIKKPEVIEALKTFHAALGDFITSDREAAAFTFALEKLTSVQEDAAVPEETEEKIILNAENSFAKQVDEILNGADTISTHLKVCSTPYLLRQVGMPDLPILMTARHLKSITLESGNDHMNYHGLGIEVVKKLPELIADPVMIMDSLTRVDSIVVLTSSIDSQNRPIIGAIMFDGKGNYNNVEIEANILKSVYGRNNFNSFLERNLANNSILYCNKEKSQGLLETPGIQFPNNFQSLSFNTIIRKSRAFVNSSEQNNFENLKLDAAVPEQAEETAQQAVPEKPSKAQYEFLDLTLAQRETQPRDGMQWEVLNADDADYDVYTMYSEQAEDITELEHADNLDFTYTDAEGNKHYVEVRTKAIQTEEAMSYEQDLLNKYGANMSPAYHKYLTAAVQNPDKILAWRLGDFYEVFDDHAKKVSELFDLTLTGRDCGLPERVPMCGFPYHTAEDYVKRLAEQGVEMVLSDHLAAENADEQNNEYVMGKGGVILKDGEEWDKLAPEDMPQNAEPETQTMYEVKTFTVKTDDGRFITVTDNFANEINTTMPRTVDMFESKEMAQEAFNDIKTYVDRIENPDGSVSYEHYCKILAENVYELDENGEIDDLVDSSEVANDFPVYVAKKAEQNAENESTKEKETETAAPEQKPSASEKRGKTTVEQIRDEMVAAIIESMKNNPEKWEKGWAGYSSAPENGKSHKTYRGINNLYLSLVAEMKGYKDNRWVTYNQAQELEANVNKGEKSTPILYYSQYDKKTKKEFKEETVKGMTAEEREEYIKQNVHSVLKYSRVFNAEQCSNFPEKTELPEMSEEERAHQNAQIESIIANSAAPVHYDGGDRAYYAPYEDAVHLPEIKYFKSMQDYYATALHEIAHSTGHKSRLNRKLDNEFADSEYALEELRAELSSVFLQAQTGIKLDGAHINNHGSYISSWLKYADSAEGSKKFYTAISDAQKISDYVISNYLKEKQAEEITPAETPVQSVSKETPVQTVSEQPKGQTPQRAVPEQTEETAQQQPVPEEPVNVTSEKSAQEEKTQVPEAPLTDRDKRMKAALETFIASDLEDNGAVSETTLEAIKMQDFEYVDGELIKSQPKIEQNAVKASNLPAEPQTTPLRWEGAEKPNRASGSQYATFSDWKSIQINAEQLSDKEYGGRNLVRLPADGEYKKYVVFISKNCVRKNEKTGAVYVRVKGDGEYAIKNDGLEAKLNGAQLAAALQNKPVGVEGVRVALTKATSKRLENIEKNVPEEMKALPNWCAYYIKWDEKKNKYAKKLVSPNTDGWSVSTDPATWSTFDEAMKYVKEKKSFAGLAFALSDGITCIDFDHQINRKDGTLSPEASEIYNDLKGTYIERSVSGDGLHIFVKGDVRENDKYATKTQMGEGEMEVFDGKRIISMTGDLYEGGTNELRTCPTQTSIKIQQKLGTAAEKKAEAVPAKTTKTYNNKNTYLTESVVLERIKNSKDADKFDAYYSGKLKFDDRSRNDMSLLRIIGFYSNYDEAIMAGIFRSSALYRPDHAGGDKYLDLTINNVIATRNDNGYKSQPLAANPKHGATKKGAPHM